MINLDFSNVPDRGALDDGVYDAQIANVEEVQSSNGNPMLKVEFDILGVEGDRKVWGNVVMVDAAMFKVKEFFNALGMDTSAVVEIDPMELVGQQMKLRLGVKKYNGEDRNEIKRFMPA